MSYQIDLEQMAAHARKLQDVSDQINTAVGAGQATSNTEAFGKLGYPLALICSAAQHRTMDTLRDAAEAAVDHVKRVDGWREHVKNNEEAQTGVFDGMYNG